MRYFVVNKIEFASNSHKILISLNKLSFAHVELGIFNCNMLLVHPENKNVYILISQSLRTNPQIEI